MHSLTNIVAAALLAANAAVASGVTMNLYHDNNCQDFWYTATIDGLTCMPTSEGFSSMMITGHGDIGHVRVYSANTCAGSLGTQYEVNEWTGRCAGFDTCNSASLEA